MRHLTGHHVDLVIKCDGDNHVGLFGPGLSKNVRMCAVADKATHVQLIANGVDQLGRRIDHGHVVLFRSQTLGNAVAHLPRAANHDFHGKIPFPPCRYLSLPEVPQVMPRVFSFR